jgi:chemotaxis signal transduction protein
MALSVLPLRLQRSWLGFEAKYVSEVVGGARIRALGGLGEWGVGVTEWRGRAVTVIDTAVFFADACPREEARRLAIVEHDEVTFAVAGADAREVQLLADLEPADGPHIVARATMWEAPLVVADVPGLVRALRAQP